MTTQPPFAWPSRASDAHKGTFGRCLLVGGSRGMAGAVSLSSLAALHTGAGLVTAAIPDRILETVASFHPAIMTVGMPDDHAGRFSIGAAHRVADLRRRLPADAIGVGPGMTTEAGSIEVVESLWTTRGCPRIIDADALNVVAASGLIQQRRQTIKSNDRVPPLVLTPHPGELQRLTGVSSGDRDHQVLAAQQLAMELDAIIVVKGGPTVVVDANQTWTNTTGNPGMATAGSGDVLTGVLTALIAQRLPDDRERSLWDRVRFGVWLHGQAGDLAAQRFGQAGMTSLDILNSLPSAWM